MDADAVILGLLSDIADVLEAISVEPDASFETRNSARMARNLVRSRITPIQLGYVKVSPVSVTRIVRVGGDLRSAFGRQDFDAAVGHAITLDSVLPGDPLTGPKPPGR